MKKSLLMLATTALTAMSLSAQPALRIDRSRTLTPTTVQDNLLKGSTENGWDLSFYGELVNWTGVSYAGTYTLELTVPAKLASKLAGNKLEALGMSVASTTVGKTFSGTIYVKEGNNYIVKDDATFTNNYNQKDETWPLFNELQFSTPYVIKEDTEFVFGYTIETTDASGDYPIAYGTNCNFMAGGGSFVCSQGALDFDFFNDLGRNLALYGVTTGSVTRIDDIYGASSASSVFTLDMIEANKSADVVVNLQSMGDKGISSVTYKAWFGDATPVENTIAVDVAAGSEGNVTLTTPNVPEGRNSLNLEITKINDFETSLGLSYDLLGYNKGFSRNVLCEEFTNTNCQYCPAGIVGLDNMAKYYPDNFIGVAAHILFGGSPDIMYVQNYQTLVNSIPALQNGIPTSIINRDPLWVVYPSTANLGETSLIDAQKAWTAAETCADIALEVTDKTESTWTVKATTTFGFSEENANYRLAFVTLEDGIEGKQKNGFSGKTSYDTEYVGDFKNLKNPTDWVFTHIARTLEQTFGIEGSIPTSVSEATPAEYTVELDHLKIDPEHPAYVVAMLLDVKTGVVLNSKKIKVQEAGIDNVTVAPTENEVPVYYNLQGIRVANPQAGQVYICVKGREASKVVL